MKMSYCDGKTVTLLIELPVSGMLHDYVEAVRIARNGYAELRNPAAAQALHALLVLAEAGVALHNLHPTPHLVVEGE